jgi:subtilisin family serine protease
MPTVWDKLDDGLASVYSKYLQGLGGEKLHVLIRYRGDPSELVTAGYEMVWNDGAGRATGALRMEDVERVAARPEVIRISYSRDHDPDLDKSIPDIKANQVWNLTGGVFTQTTGNGVLIGIIDTGIDFTHDFFMSSLSPKTTRILRIWDQGLIKVGAESNPVVGALHSGTPGTYGVEYTHAEINAFLRAVPGALAIRHRDCSGHGTHVASIAAGDGRTAFTHVGVAPKAELVIVKLLSPANTPRVGGTPVSFEQRFMDAIYYIFSLGVIQTKPVVINYSAGSAMGPHDGLTETEDWLSNEFRPAASAGKIFVKSSGNAAGSRQHARIVFAASGTIEIPFELYDRRVNTQEFDTCSWEDNTKQLLLQFYYPTGGATITGAFKPEGVAGFTAGPASGGAPVSGPFSGRTFQLRHSTDSDGQIGGAIISRELFVVEVNHHAVNGHLTGTTYKVKLTASAGVTVHVWCSQARGHGFRLGTPLPAGVTQEDRFLISEPGGARNIVTVAAFNAETAGVPVASFSSRGPVARHGPAGGVPPAKPELGAPGANIDAASSSNVRPIAVGQLASKNGSSMAAPHVTGTVALMLEKNHNLTSADVISILTGHLRTSPAPVAEEIGAGRLDAKDAVDNT